MLATNVFVDTVGVMSIDLVNGTFPAASIVLIATIAFQLLDFTPIMTIFKKFPFLYRLFIKGAYIISPKVKNTSASEMYAHTHCARAHALRSCTQMRARSYTRILTCH